MRNITQNPLWRSILLLVLGCLLVYFAEDAPKWCVVACGVAFLLPGVVALIGYFASKTEDRPIALIPFISVGCIMFGTYMVIYPESFINYLMYTLAALLLVVSSVQCYNIALARRQNMNIHASFFAPPVLLFVCALLIIFYKGEVVKMPFILLGATYIVYGVVELIITILMHRERKRLEKLVSETANIEEADFEDVSEE